MGTPSAQNINIRERYCRIRELGSELGTRNRKQRNTRANTVEERNLFIRFEETKNELERARSGQKHNLEDTGSAWN